ncbi:MAG: PPOX class F420-dependent oxidoreductase [Thermomicrobiales bacterium]
MPLTDQHRAFLDQPLNAIVATLRGDGLPSQSVVWFLRDGDDIWMSIRPESVKVRHLQRDPRVSVLVLSADGTAYLRLEGTARVVGEVNDDMRFQLISKYLGAENARERMLAHPLPSPNACVRITPERGIGHRLG